MRHPSEYSMTPFLGVHVMEVDAGTVIKDERSGKEITVSDTETVFKGNVMFCTKKTFDALKAKLPTAGAA